MSSGGFYGKRSPLSTGFACRCPRCGRGKLYKGFLTVADRCEACGLDLKKADSGDGPAVFMIFILGFLIVPLAVVVQLRFEPPMWVYAVVWPLVILGLALGLLRPLKAVMIALQFRHRASDSGSVRYD